MLCKTQCCNCNPTFTKRHFKERTPQAEVSQFGEGIWQQWPSTEINFFSYYSSQNPSVEKPVKYYIDRIDHCNWLDCPEWIWWVSSQSGDNRIPGGRTLRSKMIESRSVVADAWRSSRTEPGVSFHPGRRRDSTTPWNNPTAATKTNLS